MGDHGGRLLTYCLVFMSVSRGAPVPESSILRVGSARIDVPLREVRGRDGAGPMRRVTPKALGVLLELAARPGQVVGREELLAAVWPGTLPTDDVLTQAITQLRKAFRAACGPEECIQTIAKSGYRLLAPVQWELAPPPPPVVRTTGDHPVALAEPATAPAHAAAPRPATLVAAAATPAGRPGHRWGWAALVGSVVLATLAWAAWSRWSSPPPARVPPPAASALVPAREPPAVLRVTSAPGPESSPTLSPDGRRVAYVAVPAEGATPALHVQAVTDAAARVLSRPVAPAADDSPAFSPDGQRIAYRRAWPDGRCEVRIAEANGLGDRRIAACPAGTAPGLDWSPDASRLVAALAADPLRPTRLQVLELASARWTPLPTGAGVADIEAMPRFTPAGDAVVFVRNAQAGDLWRVGIAGGTATRLTRLQADIRGWSWAPGGETVVLSHFLEGDFRLARVGLGDGRATDLGLASAQQPAVARGTARLAFVESSAAFGLQRARLPAGGPSAHVLEPMLPSTGRDLMPALGPDGDQLLFASTRSGSLALWSARLSDPASLRRVAGVQPRARHAPVWREDGRKALLPTVDARGRGGLMEFDAASGTARALPVPGSQPQQAAYGAPGELLVVEAPQDGPARLARYDTRGTPWRLLARWPDATRVRVAAGRAWFTRPGRVGLWSLDLTLDPGSLRVEDAARPALAEQRLWEIDAEGRAWLLGPVPGCAARLRPLGRDTGPGRCLDARNRPAFNGFSLARDGRSALFAAVTDEEADIAVLPLAAALSGKSLNIR